MIKATWLQERWGSRSRHQAGFRGYASDDCSLAADGCSAGIPTVAGGTDPPWARALPTCREVGPGRKLAVVDEAGGSNDYIRFLCNRLILRPTGRTLAPYGVKEYKLLTHPWLVEEGWLAGTRQRGERGVKQGEVLPERGGRVPPLKMNKTRRMLLVKKPTPRAR